MLHKKLITLPLVGATSVWQQRGERDIFNLHSLLYFELSTTSMYIF